MCVCVLYMSIKSVTIMDLFYIVHQVRNHYGLYGLVQKIVDKGKTVKCIKSVSIVCRGLVFESYGEAFQNDNR